MIAWCLGLVDILRYVAHLSRNIPRPKIWDAEESDEEEEEENEGIELV